MPAPTGVSKTCQRQRTVVEHWNGKTWKAQQSPNPGGSPSSLASVSATSPTNAWAVGSYSTVLPPPVFNVSQTLVEHWNGKGWTVQKSPSPGRAPNNPGDEGTDTNNLLGVAVTSPTNAWAAGYYLYDGTVYQTLVEHRG